MEHRYSVWGMGDRGMGIGVWGVGGMGDRGMGDRGMGYGGMGYIRYAPKKPPVHGPFHS